MTLLKGALAAFAPTFLKPVPNITVFQYNPETLTHTWTQVERASGAGVEAGNPLAVPGMPGEEFSLTIVLDSSQDIADGKPVSAALAEVSGVYTRLAALEMLLYPTTGGAMSQLLGQTTAALGLASAGCKQNVPKSTVPVVLFVWGPFRVVPVCVTGLTITETLYDTVLNPTHAEAQLRLRVLTPTELEAAAVGGELLAKLATVAYTYTLGVRQAAALANLGNLADTAAGPVGMLFG